MVIWQREVWWRSQWCYWDNYIEYWVRRQHQFKLHAWFLRWWWKGTWGILIIIVILIYLFVIYSHVWNLLIIYSIYLYLDLHVYMFIHFFASLKCRTHSIIMSWNSISFFDHQIPLFLLKNQMVYTIHLRSFRKYGLSCRVIRLFLLLLSITPAVLDIFWTWPYSVRPQCQTSWLNVYAQDFQPGGLRGCR